MTDLLQHRQTGDAGQPEIAGEDTPQEVRVAMAEVQHLTDEARLQQIGAQGQYQQGDQQQADAAQNIKEHG
ncbi:hypothetical protein D3C72_1878330 [compost metagenome]